MLHAVRIAVITLATVTTTLIACSQHDPAPPTRTVAGSGSGTATPQDPPPSPPKEPAVEPWSTPVDGIRIRIDAPTPSVRAGESVTMALTVENTSDRPRRIYMLGPEVFRAMISDLRVLDADGKPIGMSQPEPHPHGYLPTEADFPLIAANSQQRFTQHLSVDAALAPGPITVVWDYENKITSMPGGIQTLDGTTKPLFGGGDIPDIWTGELTARTTIDVTK
jgi:hypothetical protein